MTAEEKIKFEKAQKELNEEKVLFTSPWYHDGFLELALENGSGFLIRHRP